MAPFNPKKVMRLASRNLLTEFFEHHNASIEPEWDAPPMRRVESIFEEYLKLPEKERLTIEIALHDIHEMANENGMLVLAVEARAYGCDLSPVEYLDSLHDRALWVSMHCPEVWESSVRFNQADDILAGRYWLKRDGLPLVEADTSPESCRRLALALAAFFRNKEGRGHKCAIEHFSRADGTDYFFVYLSDFADNYAGFDESGAFLRMPQRRAFEVVYAYRGGDGILEIYAKGGKAVITPLLQIFSRVVLGHELPPEDQSRNLYNLDGLLDTNFQFPTDPEDGIEKVTIRGLRLAVMGRPRSSRITLESKAANGFSSVYDMLEDDLDQKRLPRSLLQVSRATINFRFRGRGRTRSLTFNISLPNACDVRNKREDLRVLAEKYLKTWGIDIAQSA